MDVLVYFIHLLTEGHSGFFQVLVLISKVALNIHVHFGGSEYKFSIHLGKYIFFIQHVNSLRSLLEWARVYKIILHLIYVSWLNHLESSTWTDSEEANSGMRTRVTHCAWTEGERKIFSLFIVFISILCRAVFPFGWNSMYQVFPPMNFYFGVIYQNPLPNSRSWKFPSIFLKNFLWFYIMHLDLWFILS